jgi:putative FmdB family regulatory protein
MATYDLICNVCGNGFEVFRQGFLKDGDRVCPECGSLDVRQKFSGFLRGLSTPLGGGCSTPSGSPFG